MKRYLPRVAPVILALFFVAYPTFRDAPAQEKAGLAGWEKESRYNALYNPAEMDSFKGEVVDIKEVVPFPGMAPGVGLTVRDQDNDVVEVHLGPKAFVDPGALGLKKGDKVKLKGSWAEVGQDDVFLASKVKKGEYEELKVRRTKDGTPFWTMSPEELAKEKGEE